MILKRVLAYLIQTHILCAMSMLCGKFCPAFEVCNGVFDETRAIQQSLQSEVEHYRRAAAGNQGQDSAPTLAVSLENISYGFAVAMQADITNKLSRNDKRYLAADVLLGEFDTEVAAACNGPRTGLWGALVVRSTAIRSHEPVKAVRSRYLEDHAKCSRPWGGKAAIRLAKRI